MKINIHNKLYMLMLILLASCATPKSQNPFLLVYPDLEGDYRYGEVVLENENVILQKLIVGAGQWEGVHSHPGNQLYVHIRGGEWSGKLNGEFEYYGEIDEDGSVGWMDAIPESAGHNSGNTGDNDIELIYVTLKKDTPLSPQNKKNTYSHMNQSLELLFENERLIAHRQKLEPGQWQNSYNLTGDQLYIFIKGGQWAVRKKGEPYNSQFYKAGSAELMKKNTLEESFEYGNMGNTLIEIVWVTLK
tara:strand:- start:1984 stop:2721 length:738 start_codon:yes stop_codon:yes gene_type:complete